MWVVYRLPNFTRKTGSREIAMLGFQLVIAVFALNLGYGFEGSFTQLENFSFVSDLLTSRSDAARLSPGPSGIENRFAKTLIGRVAMPLPKNYLLGIDAEQYDFEHSGRLSYLRGQWRSYGWWYYYLYVVYQPH